MQGEQSESLTEDPSVREAVAVVFERTDGGAEELKWADVRDSMSSEQWGTLIQREVLVSGDTGFVLANPDRVRRELEREGIVDERDADATGDEASESEGEESEVEEIESESWEWYDKVAAVGAVVLFFGYWNTGLRDVIASADNAILAPVTHAFPFYVVVLILSAATGLYSTVLQDRLMDNEKVAKYKERMDRLNERREEAKENDDDEALEQIQEEQIEAATDQLGMFKLQFRPMVWIMLLTIPVFLWLRWKVRGGHMGVAESGMVVPLAGAVGWTQPLLGPMPTWIVWYFLCSMASRQLIQKFLNVQTSPTS